MGKLKNVGIEDGLTIEISDMFALMKKLPRLSLTLIEKFSSPDSPKKAPVLTPKAKLLEAPSFKIKKPKQRLFSPKAPKINLNPKLNFTSHNFLPIKKTMASSYRKEKVLLSPVNQKMKVLASAQRKKRFISPLPHKSKIFSPASRQKYVVSPSSHQMSIFKQSHRRVISKQ